MSRRAALRRWSSACSWALLNSLTFPGTKLCWSEQAFADFLHRLKRLTGRSWGVSMATRYRKLAEYLRGWMGHFGISDYYRPVPGLDSWLRRRVRMCYWKQWKRRHTRITNLLALGTSRNHALATGMSRKGYWHLATALPRKAGHADRDDERMARRTGTALHP